MSESVAAAPAAPAVAATPAPAAVAAPVETAKASGDTTKIEAVPAVAGEVQKYKVVVDGVEEEVTLDELLRNNQTRKASDKRFREAAEERKAADTQRAELNGLLNAIKNDPEAFAKGIRNMGLDPIDVAERLLKPAIDEQVRMEEEAKQTPEQREAAALKRELEQYKQKEAAAKQKEEEAEKAKKEGAYKQEVEQKADKFGNAIVQAMASLKDKGLPQTNETALKLLDLVQLATERGLEVDPRHLVADLLEQERGRVSFLKDPNLIDPELRKQIMREAMNDPELKEAIRKESVEAYKNSLNTPKVAGGKLQQSAEKGPTKRPSYSSVSMDLLRKSFSKNS